MAQRFLAIDWDQNQLHVVSASLSGGAVRFHRAVRLDTEATPNLGNAEELGKLLRQRLADNGLGAAPVLACLGRDRVILKEVRFPPVPDHDEPNVVRFQAVKELTDNPDDVVIDYAALPASPTESERRAQVMIVRKELVNAYKALCEAAGLRLAGLAPRAYGMAACLRRLLGTSVLVPPPEPADAPVALVTVGEKWAEFCILKGETLLQARTLSVGAGLAGEIRRNLAVFAGQHAANTVKAVYLALSGEQAALREKLVASLDIPVHPFDPFAGAEDKGLPASGRGTFAGAVGLLHLMAQQRRLPVNFAQVKQAYAPKDPHQRLHILAGSLALLLLAGGFLFARMTLTEKKKEVDFKRSVLADRNRELSFRREERVLLQALHDWETVNWVDEMYDFVARMPRVDMRFRLQSLDAVAERPTFRGGTPTTLQQQREKPPSRLEELSSRPVGRLHLKLLAAGGPEPLNKLNEELLKSDSPNKKSVFYRPLPHTYNRGVYEKEIQIFMRPPDQYTRKIGG